MNNEVFWIIELSIHEGAYDDFKALMEEMVEATKTNESGALNYEWYISEDHKLCNIHERYADSEALMIHMQNFGSQFAQRFTSLVSIVRFQVYGDLSEEANEAVSKLGAWVLKPWGGFKR